MTPGFTEDWFCQESQDVLTGLVGEVADVEGMILEIGSWEGRSTCALANAAHPRIVHSVDTWQGSPSDVSSELASGRDVYGQWVANVAAFSKGNVAAHRMGWRDFVPTITGPVALAFVDAEHTYREVCDQIEALSPLIASGGILCGDDIAWGPVKSAVAAMIDPYQVWFHASMWIWRT